MGHQYVAIGWNRQKRLYDLYLLLFVLLYFAVFVSITLSVTPEVTMETILIRTTGSLAIVILHVILCIGPLCRLNRFFLPLLYNRRHLGVFMSLIALVHGVFSIVQFHTLGNLPALESLFLSNTSYNDFANFPFMVPGFFALLIILLMSFSSHDFWLNLFGARFWKALHMFVYVAYVLLLLHVLTGAYQQDQATLTLVLLAIGAFLVISLHLTTAFKEINRDQPVETKASWVPVAKVEDIPLNRAKIVRVRAERVAVFRYNGFLAATSNVCQHQNGPLGEGCVIDGVITCPWHGYQYRPEDGCSPPPFTEKVATYHLKIDEGMVFVYDKAEAPGTAVDPIPY